MFCDEPILHVYQCMYYEDKEQPWHNAILRLTGSFEYHATEGYWLVFQTEHFVISLGHDGVQVYTCMNDFCPEDELDPLSDIEDWTHTEETLFVGERIHAVNREDMSWTVRFDHFSLKLCGYTEHTAKAINRYHDFTHNRIPLAVGKHLLNRKCACGGEGEIFMDFVSDYQVRCKNCHASTWAGMCLIDAIDDWNNADTPIHLDTGEEKFFAKVREQPIQYIALEDRGLWYATEQSCEANRAVIAFADDYFLIDSRVNGEDESSFDFCHCSDYNKSLFSHTITPRSGHIQFLKANDSLGECLYFLMDNTILTIAPFDTFLIVALTESDPDGIIVHELDRDCLPEMISP